MVTVQPQDLEEVTIDDIQFKLRLVDSQPYGTQVVQKYAIEFAVTWQGGRTDYLFHRTGKVTQAVEEQELREENLFRGDNRWVTRSTQPFRGSDKWRTWSPEPYEIDRGRSFASSEAGLRWLYLCGCYYKLRPNREAYSVSEFLTTAEELASQKAPFHGARVDQALCGFAPEESAEWQLYQQSYRSGPTFTRVCVGPESVVCKYLEEDDGSYHPRTALLLDPRNVVKKVMLL